MKRRDVLFGLGLASALFAGARVRPAKARIRPPGAGTEEEFEDRCIRCFRCAEVCPPKAIVLDESAVPRLADLPMLELRDKACVLCMACTDVCPTDALRPIDPAPEIVQREVRMGRPELDRQACLPWARKGVCRLCFYACPYAGSAIRLSGPLQGPVFHEQHCVGCGLCEEACPEEARAIRILPTEPT